MPRVFGSVACSEDSDFDLLVDLHERMSLFDLGAIIAELKEPFGIRVGIATPAALPRPIRRPRLCDAVALRSVSQKIETADERRCTRMIPVRLLCRCSPRSLICVHLRSSAVSISSHFDLLTLIVYNNP